MDVLIPVICFLAGIALGWVAAEAQMEDMRRELRDLRDLLPKD